MRNSGSTPYLDPNGSGTAQNGLVLKIALDVFVACSAVILGLLDTP